MIGSIDSLLTSMGSYSSSSSRNVQNTSQIYDYKAGQQQTKQMLDTYKTNTTAVTALKKDSAAFLKQYTGNVNDLNQTASKLTGANLDKLLTDKEGQVTDTTIGNTVTAMKDMVASYNKNLTFLNSNASRGPGVANQIGRMARDPASKEAMQSFGLGVNKDGSLALDEAKMASALRNAAKTEDKGQLNLLKDAIGGATGVAKGVQRDAQAGLREPAGKLIANDLANMKNIQESDPIRNYARDIRGGGAYYMNNMAAGVMMNLLA